MIYNLFGFDFFLELEILQLVIFCSILGNIFRLILSFFHNQQWTRTRLQFLNFSFLPAITFIITKIISGNIALSLGMVGALSIVRLRTPVKNPFELIAYFFLITLGIVTSVNPNIAINFLIITFLISLLIELINKYISDPNKKNYFIDAINININLGEFVELVSKKLKISERDIFFRNSHNVIENYVGNKNQYLKVLNSYNIKNISIQEKIDQMI